MVTAYVEHVCPGCESAWDVAMEPDHGTLFYRQEDDVICPECGILGVPTVIVRSETAEYL